MVTGPDPAARFPLEGERSMVFLKNVVNNPQIEVGDYTYYHDFDDPAGFEANVRYLFPFISDRLVIGRFCAIASGATFLMNGGNHRTDGIATYPFGIFGQGWEAAIPESWPHKGDLVVGHDVWIGYRATLMAGVTVGHGAVIGAMSVVTADVPAYAVVAGNPARVIRHRQPPEVVERLLRLAWWDWPIKRITRHVRIIASGDVDSLEAAARGDAVGSLAAGRRTLASGEEWRGGSASPPAPPILCGWYGWGRATRVLGEDRATEEGNGLLLPGDPVRPPRERTVA